MGVIYTSINTRAAHLELAGLSMNSFLLSMRCYISWRGQVSVMRSDNHIHFDGAIKEIKVCIKNITQTKIQHYLSS